MDPMFGVPLKAMCSNMCARPVIPATSCAEPASTWVKNEKTGRFRPFDDEKRHPVGEDFLRHSFLERRQVLGREGEGESQKKKGR